MFIFIEGGVRWAFSYKILLVPNLNIGTELLSFFVPLAYILYFLALCGLSKRT
jgi:hypothetical protein